MLVFLLFGLMKAIDDEIPFATDEELAEEALKPRPTPEPPLIQKSFKEIVGIRELFVLIMFLFYGIWYAIGNWIIKKERNSITSKLNHGLRKYFAVVPDLMQPKSNNKFYSYITGRTKYFCAFIQLYLPKKSDLFGFIIDKLLMRKTHLSIELVPISDMAAAAVFYLVPKRPKEANELDLKERTIDGMKLKLYTDFGPSRKVFVDEITKFNKSHPNCIKSIIMTDTNHFTTRQEGRFVVKIDIDINDKIENIINDELADFIVKLGDEFAVLRLTEKTFVKTIKTRQQLFDEAKKEYEAQHPDKVFVPPKEINSEQETEKCEDATEKKTEETK